MLSWRHSCWKRLFEFIPVKNQGFNSIGKRLITTQVLRNRKLLFSKFVELNKPYNAFWCSNVHSSNMAPVPSTTQFIDGMIKENIVVIFSKSTCPFCNKVKALFDKTGTDYKAYELDLEENGGDIQEVLFAKTNQKTVPNIYIHGKHLGGASDAQAAFENGRLHQLLSGDESKYDYDLLVIGGGSGGLSCSKEAADLGAKVAVADFVKPSPAGSIWGLGGTCVNVGCIPKKLMHQAALLGEAVNDSRSFGWNVEEKTTHDWPKMVQAIQNHVHSLNFGYKVSLMKKKVKYYNKYAKFIDNHKVQLTDKAGKTETITARTFVLAMGGRPNYPDVPGVLDCAITSDDIFSLPHSPGKTLFCGASYIALECAGFLHGVGLNTTVMMRSIPLRGFDQDMANKVAGFMEKSGIRFLKRYTLVKMEKLEEGTPGKICVTYMNHESGKEESDEYNTVVMAVGRAPCTKDIGLQDIGVNLNPKNGFVISNDSDQTNIENIFGIGDVLDGKPELTPVAIQAGKLLARRLYSGSSLKCDYTNVPTTIFTPLEYGACGLSEEAATEKYGEENIEVYHSNFTPLETTVPYRLDNECYAKLVCNSKENMKVVGIHILGPNAGEVVQGFSIALKLGATKHSFDDLIGIHPTNAEVFTTLHVTKRSGASAEVTGC